MGRFRDLSARPGARRRWAVVAVVIGLLVAAPAAIAALPVHAPAVSTATLLARIRASGAVPFQGYAETSGRLAFPDLGQFSDATRLLSQTSRLRVWEATETHYRLDVLSTGGEHDYYRDGGSGAEWDSGHRNAVVVTRYPPVRIPSAPFVVPPTLARRLLDGVPASAMTRIGSRRVAGRTTVGLRVPAADPRSLIDHVDVWVDPGDGLPLAVRIVPKGDPAAAFDSRFLDLSLRAPSAERLAFRPDLDPTATFGSEADGGGIDGAGNHHPLPASLDALPKRSVAGDGTATYGRRFSLLTVIPVDAPLAYALRQNLDSESRPPVRGAFGEGSEVLTPMLSAIVFAAGDDGYLVVGTVARASLERVATDLARASR